jgi:hypothetical protein
MAFVRRHVGWLAVIGLLSACGSSDDVSIPPGTGGNAGSTGDGSATGGSAGSAGNGGSSGSSGSTAGSSGAAGAECNGTHPLLDGGVRFCAPGECRCEGTDLCFPQDRAARCCDGQLRCFTEDGGVTCEGSHPLVDGGARFCEQGKCYCAADDACFSAATASICCGASVDCG